MPVYCMVPKELWESTLRERDEAVTAQRAMADKLAAAPAAEAVAAQKERDALVCEAEADRWRGRDYDRWRGALDCAAAIRRGGE